MTSEGTHTQTEESVFSIIILAKYAHPQRHVCYRDSFLIKQSAVCSVINICCSSISSEVSFVFLYCSSHSVSLQIPTVLWVFALRLLSRLYIGPHESPTIVQLTSLSVKSIAYRKTLLFSRHAFKTQGKFSWRPC